MNTELAFISGAIFDIELPKEMRYLYKYFKTDIQRQFLRYYYVYGNWTHFLDHTGLYCKVRWLYGLETRLKFIQNMHRKAKADFDLGTIALLESGKFKAGKIK